MKTKTAMQEAIDKIEELVSIRNFQKWEQLKKEFLEKERKQLESYTSQPMSAEPTVQQLREASKNNPDTFLAGALYVIDNYKLNSPSMSAEQVEEIETVIKNLMEQYRYAVDSEYRFSGAIPTNWDGDTELPSYEAAKELLKKLSTAPTVKAEGWVSVEDKLPEVLETVWVSNGKGWTALGCRTDYYENDEGGFDWCWAGSNGIIYEESGKIVSECEEDDLDVRFWHPLPEPPATK